VDYFYFIFWSLNLSSGIRSLSLWVLVAVPKKCDYSKQLRETKLENFSPASPKGLAGFKVSRGFILFFLFVRMNIRARSSVGSETKSCF